MDLDLMEDLPCAMCGKVMAERDERSGHTHRRRAEDLARLSDTEMKSLIRYSTRRRKGEHDPPLPPPAERRRIRKGAGLSQQRVADLLHVSRHTVGRWERTAGHPIGQERLPGREPVGELRRAYAALLED